MVSKLSLLSGFLLVSAALAVPSSRRRGHHQSRLNSHFESSDDGTSDVSYSTNWAGAVQSESEGTFNTVTGTFTVPTPSGSDGAASAWVGIDGDTCQNAILQTGIEIILSGGEASYAAWYEWLPDHEYNFSGITISAGDVIRATVTAYSTTSGTAVIENLTNNQTVSQDLTSSAPLCQQDAEWIVEDFTLDGSPVPFVDFGSLTFTDATASSSIDTYTLSGANIFDIDQGAVLTSTSNDGSSLTINYL